MFRLWTTNMGSNPNLKFICFVVVVGIWCRLTAKSRGMMTTILILKATKTFYLLSRHKIWQMIWCPNILVTAQLFTLLPIPTMEIQVLSITPSEQRTQRSIWIGMISLPQSLKLALQRLRDTDTFIEDSPLFFFFFLSNNLLDSHRFVFYM